ncbi:MAG TPA: DUF5916 domain-containing protein [Gammaproteobacteria bacterium]|nr:DUF5916 domain-containing protein [Gammaproteobacteria bacterium]
MPSPERLTSLRTTLVAVVTLLIGAPALGQELSIPPVVAPPTMADFVGMNPSEDVRSRYAYVTGFTQRTPQNGAPSAQRTDVYLGYDSRNLYAVFLAFDDDPASVRANLAPRENIDNDDNLGLVIDTFDDQRTGYGFYSSPLGVQWDGRWSDVTRGGWDTSYEAVWQTDAQLTDGGYVVVMTIPFRAMRFPETSEQRWRVQFERIIPRLSEESQWPAWSQAIDGRLNQTAVVTGVRDVSPGRNVQLIPFAFVRSYDVLDGGRAGGPGFTKDTEDDFGLDAKVVLKDSFVLDFTYNPDFSQVESDQPQVTVNERFEVQFPERRPFFLENADYFAAETPLLFTRRIVDPKVGLKFTGRQGPWGIGTMLINDEAPGQRAPPTDPLYGEDADISVLRVFRDFGDQSRAGFMHTERELGNTYSRVSAADTYIKLTDNWLTELLMVNTENRLADGRVITGRETNWRVNRNSRNFNAHYHYTAQSSNFAVPLGILSRNYTPDAEGLHGFMEYRFWPEDTWIDRIGPRVFFQHQEDRSGTRLYSEFSPQLQIAWAGASFFAVGTNDIRERLRPRDFVGLTTTRDYAQTRWFTNISSDPLQTFGFSFNYDQGTVINFVPPLGAEPELADRDYIEGSIRWRPIDRLRIDTTLLSTTLDDRNGRGKIFDDRILRTRVNYQFSKEMSLRVILQHEETTPTALSRLTNDENLNLDLLFRYVLNPWSALYVGYNNNESNLQLVDTPQGTQLLRSEDLARDGQQFFVKFSYLLQP